MFSAVFYGCGNENAGQPDTSLLTVTDLAGRTVSFAAYPKRIISLAPSNTEILFALGAGQNIVGRTKYCDFPAEALSITNIGDLGNPDRELVLSLNPDCIVASYKTQAQLFDFFSRYNIPVIISEATSFNQIAESINLLGNATNKKDAAEKIVQGLKEKTAKLEKQLEGTVPVRCYYAVSFGNYGNWTAGKGSFLHDIIEKAGGENLGAVIGKPWGEISPETIVSLNPDVVILGKYSGPVGTLASSAGLRELVAVKNNRIIVVDDDLVGRPGPRIVDGLQELAEKLHPDVFIKRDVQP